MMVMFFVCFISNSMTPAVYARQAEICPGFIIDDPQKSALSEGYRGGFTALYYAATCPGNDVLKRSDFKFDLPAKLIAQMPLEQRSASRLLRLRRSGGFADAMTLRSIEIIRSFPEIPLFMTLSALLPAVRAAR